MAFDLADTVVIKRASSFLLSLRDGRLSAAGSHPLGLWHRDCRFLAAHELRLNGVRPLPVRAPTRSGGARSTS